MPIRLTKNLKRIIAGQFKGGDSIDYLASVYGVAPARIEQVIREALNSEESGARSELAGPGHKRVTDSDGMETGK